MSKGVLYIVSGPSGTGKGTICQELVERRDVYLSVSTTSRDQRAGETAGITYNYTTPEHFKEMIEEDQMLEWAVYSGNYYGTPKGQIDKNLNAGRDVILEIEPQGAMKVKAQRPEAVMIFVIPPSMEVLRDRLSKRGRETEEQIIERIEAAKWEFQQAEKYQYVVVNGDLEECVSEFMAIMDRKTEDRQRVENLLSE